MITDKTPAALADERASFESWAFGEHLSLHRYDSGRYSHDRTFSAWLAWQSALSARPQYITDAYELGMRDGQTLSAQPSPGGQGEAMVTDVMVMAALQAVTRETLAGVGDCDSKVIGVLTAYGIDGAVDIPTMVRAMLEAALAARQPVGGQGDALSALIADWEARPGITDAYRICAEELKAALAARQPVGEPFGYCVDFDPDAHEFSHTFYYLAPGEKVPKGCTPFFTNQPAQAVDLAPRPMDTAPTDGTMVRLLVDFTSNATEDTAGPAWTIGSNNDSNVMADERVGWQFAGWCWTHDHFTEGQGAPIGWLPLLDSQAEVDRG